jgi:hypothetical protein
MEVLRQTYVHIDRLRLRLRLVLTTILWLAAVLLATIRLLWLLWIVSALPWGRSCAAVRFHTTYTET